ncbi:MAG: hypothetical protein LBF92_09630 [Synergistaceae bacterium]|jgi:hypothetical protein|nr:hypothetical protein [Synergistaceae bacterium]
MLGKNSKKYRRQGLTHTEFLIRTAILGTLCLAVWVTVLAVRASMDSAAAVNLASDLHLLKTACTGYFLDHRRMPGDGLPPGEHESIAEMLEEYYERPMEGAYGGRVYVIYSDDKTLYGLSPDSGSAPGPGALEKLKTLASVYDRDARQLRLGSNDGGPYFIVIR